MDEIDKKIVRQFQDMRINQGKSVSYYANKMGVSSSILCKVEKGNRNASMNILSKMTYEIIRKK